MVQLCQRYSAFCAGGQSKREAHWDFGTDFLGEKERRAHLPIRWHPRQCDTWVFRLSGLRSAACQMLSDEVVINNHYTSFIYSILLAWKTSFALRVHANQ